LNPRFLLDTHILVHWLIAPKKLSREQFRLLRETVRRREPFAISAITLLEIAVLFGKGSTRSDIPVETLLSRLESDPGLQVVPFTVDVASEVAALGHALRDPSDRAIVCSARIHKLRLVTSDRRIIDSNLVPVVV
jgi:PIN domain nuclease of toxin-antitoxin system